MSTWEYRYHCNNCTVGYPRIEPQHIPGCPNAEKPWLSNQDTKLIEPGDLHEPNFWEVDRDDKYEYGEEIDE